MVELMRKSGGAEVQVEEKINQLEENELTFMLNIYNLKYSHTYFPSDRQNIAKEMQIDICINPIAGSKVLFNIYSHQQCKI